MIRQWDTAADWARAELIEVAGPLLAKRYRARFHGNHPVALAYLTRTMAGVVGDIDGKASETEATWAVGLSATITRSLLTDSERNPHTRLPLAAFG